MKKRIEKAPSAKPKNETGSITPAQQILRDRLNKLKVGGHKVSGASTRGNSTTNILNRFKNTPPRNISQKSRKGFRPG